jgi:amidase
VFLGEDSAPLPAAPRLMLATDMFALAVPEAEAILRDAVGRLSLRMGDAEPVTLAPDIDPLYWAFRWLQGREAWQADGAMIARFDPPLGPGVAERFVFARNVTDAEVAEGTATRKAFTGAVKALLGTDGVILMPTVPDIAPLKSTSEADLDDFRNRALRLLCPSGLTGFPQVSIPLATRAGAPLGLSILGPPGSDRSLVHLAAKIEVAARLRIA